MLVLGRKEGEQIVIGGNVVITVVRTRDTGVRIGIDAPVEVSIRRAELDDMSDQRTAERLEQAAAAAGMGTAGGINDAA